MHPSSAPAKANKVDEDSSDDGDSVAYPKKMIKRASKISKVNATTNCKGKSVCKNSTAKSALELIYQSWKRARKTAEVSEEIALTSDKWLLAGKQLFFDHCTT